MAVLEGIKLLDVLKASGLQAFAVSATCAIVVYLSVAGVLPALEPWLLTSVVALGILTALLWVLLLIRGAVGLLDPQKHIRHWWSGRKLQKAVGAYIPHMTETERQILGYLLHRNQKTFDCASDGGHASTLIARRIFEQALIPGHHYDLEHLPMIIPDQVWDVLIKHKDSFPSVSEKNGHPWRVHWMAR